MSICALCFCLFVTFRCFAQRSCFIFVHST
jgi:hypothetical protein